MRSFSGSGGTTGYLQLQGCPATTTGMRAYIAQGAAPLQDVTASILAQAGLPDAATMTAYQEKGAGDLFAFIGVLDKVPVLRWVAEADPEQPLAADARSFDHGNAIHGGFLHWNQDHFEVARAVPAALWACDDSSLRPCKRRPVRDGGVEGIAHIEVGNARNELLRIGTDKIGQHHDRHAALGIDHEGRARTADTGHLKVGRCASTAQPPAHGPARPSARRSALHIRRSAVSGSKRPSVSATSQRAVSSAVVRDAATGPERRRNVVEPVRQAGRCIHSIGGTRGQAVHRRRIRNQVVAVAEGGAAMRALLNWRVARKRS
jgi:hypothetical protein